MLRSRFVGVVIVAAAVAVPWLPAAFEAHARDRTNPNVVIIDGKIYKLVPYQDDEAPPMPAPVVPVNPPDAIPPPADALQKKAREYLYVIPAYHFQVAREVRKDMLKTNNDVGKRGIELRDMVGVPFGAMVNDAVAKSGAIDDAGNITDKDKYARIFESIGAAQSAVLKQTTP